MLENPCEINYVCGGGKTRFLSFLAPTMSSSTVIPPERSISAQSMKFSALLLTRFLGNRFVLDSIDSTSEIDSKPDRSISNSSKANSQSSLGVNGAKLLQYVKCKPS